ncbi:unnamed protein product [Eruca vesicaria subsp. sativa]|uniref:Uncharacterized protein n=1 Tax=Eruca vesicaria subsp. sativa TaxID=29727 RepID=A0ABC8JEI3_ERUVS|nr:unnamed protein product [Eruca vesicaria subsp. sativa]
MSDLIGSFRLWSRDLRFEKSGDHSDDDSDPMATQLRKENPVFFNYFNLRCQMALQMRMFSDILTKQAVRMFENAAVKTLLHQHPARVHLLKTLAYKRKLSSASSALPYENGQAVAQTQNPYYQVLNSASFSVLNPNVPSIVQWQMPNEQLIQQLLCASSLPMPYANGPSVTHLTIPCDPQEQPLYTTSLPLSNANGPSSKACCLLYTVIKNSVVVEMVVAVDEEVAVAVEVVVEMMVAVDEEVVVAVEMDVDVEIVAFVVDVDVVEVDENVGSL